MNIQSIGHNEANRRRARRFPVMWSAVIVQGLRRWSCVVTDVSISGAKLRAIGSLALKSPVRILSDRFGALEGVIMWQRGELAGMRFSETPDGVRKTLSPLVAGLAAQPPEPAAPGAAGSTSGFGRKHSLPRAA